MGNGSISSSIFIQDLGDCRNNRQHMPGTTTSKSPSHDNFTSTLRYDRPYQRDQHLIASTVRHQYLLMGISLRETAREPNYPSNSGSRLLFNQNKLSIRLLLSDNTSALAKAISFHLSVLHFESICILGRR